MCLVLLYACRADIALHSCRYYEPSLLQRSAAVVCGRKDFARRWQGLQVCTRGPKKKKKKKLRAAVCVDAAMCVSRTTVSVSSHYCLLLQVWAGELNNY